MTIHGKCKLCSGATVNYHCEHCEATSRYDLAGTVEKFLAGNADIGDLAIALNDFQSVQGHAQKLEKEVEKKPKKRRVKK